jgi:hypothetical protein
MGRRARREPRVGDIVWIDWLDPTASSDSWVSAEEFAYQDPAYCHTVGKIMRVTADTIWVASTWTESNDAIGEGMVIPTGCVTDIQLVTA